MFLLKELPPLGFPCCSCPDQWTLQWFWQFRKGALQIFKRGSVKACFGQLPPAKKIRFGNQVAGFTDFFPPWHLFSRPLPPRKVRTMPNQFCRFLLFAWILRAPICVWFLFPCGPVGPTLGPAGQRGSLAAGHWSFVSYALLLQSMARKSAVSCKSQRLCLECVVSAIFKDYLCLKVLGFHRTV